MQNRLVLTGIPDSVPHLLKAYDSLKKLVEDHACWVDRFAFFPSKQDTEDDTCVTVTAGVELHIENVRNRAIKSLNGLVICMDREGSILNSTGCNDDVEVMSFRIYSQPANAAQSTELIKSCSIQSDDVDAENRMKKQTLNLPGGIELSVQKSEVPAGTGTYPWRGGYILSKQICHWAMSPGSCGNNTGAEDEDAERRKEYKIDFSSLFCNRAVLELGAGAAGLPSMTLGKISISLRSAMNLTCSDGIDEVVDALQANITDNELDGCINVQQIDWNDYALNDNAKVANVTEVDTIIFADCIYNEECAITLSKTIFRLLKAGGHVIGVLPSFRPGMSLFEQRMRDHGFISTNIPIFATEENDSFVCSGGGGKDYRLLLWLYSQ